MPFSARRGECLLIPLPNPENLHLFVILTEQERFTGNCIVVNIETRQRKSDTTLVLHSGDHPFITHESVVRYKSAHVVSAEKLIELVNLKRAFPKEPCLDSLLDKICAGLLKSPYTPNDVKEFYTNITWKL